MSDRDDVRALLGREPQGEFRVVVRARDGAPVVIENAPFLDDGTPMPTRYWLVGAAEQRAVGRLESSGAIRRAEAEVDATELAEAHRRYAHERDREIPADHVGARPSGGVGGTREGVKCLHAHYAWFLAGGDDPVGRWVERELRALHVTLTPDEFVAGPHRLPIGPRAVSRAHFRSDPPQPEELANAIGQIRDYLEDLLRLDPEAVTRDVVFHGPLARELANLDLGEPAPPRLRVSRDEAEELFRTVATEERLDRRHNPGLEPATIASAEALDGIVASCCVIVSVMRHLHLDFVVLTGDEP